MSGQTLYIVGALLFAAAAFLFYRLLTRPVSAAKPPVTPQAAAEAVTLAPLSTPVLVDKNGFAWLAGAQRVQVHHEVDVDWAPADEVGAVLVIMSASPRSPMARTTALMLPRNELFDFAGKLSAIAGARS